MKRICRPWTEAEVAALRAAAPAGMDVVSQRLRRSRSAIRHKAMLSGVRIARRPTVDLADSRWRGKLPVPQHVHPLVRRVYAEANEQLATLTELARQSGVDRQIIGGWHRRQPKLSDIEAVLSVLGFALKLTRQKETPHGD